MEKSAATGQHRHTGKEWAVSMNFRSRFGKSVSLGNEGQSIDPPIVAFYWEGGESSGHSVQRINVHGAAICTGDRWSIGTVLELTFQRKDPLAEAPDIVSARARIVGHTSDGIELEFVCSSRKEREPLARFLAGAATVRL
jgi:hypothetical protein